MTIDTPESLLRQAIFDVMLEEINKEKTQIEECSDEEQ